MSRHPATWRTQAALAIGRGTADDAEFAAADRVLDALEREGALLTDRQRDLLRPSARETPGDRPSAPVAARTAAAGTPDSDPWVHPRCLAGECDRCDLGHISRPCMHECHIVPPPATSPTGDPR